MGRKLNVWRLSDDVYVYFFGDSVEEDDYWVDRPGSGSSILIDIREQNIDEISIVDKDMGFGKFKKIMEDAQKKLEV